MVLSNFNLDIPSGIKSHLFCFKMGITRNRVPFDVWKWSEELKVLSIEDLSFSEYLPTNMKYFNGPFSVPHGSFSTESLQTVCLILYTIILIHLFLCVLKQQVLRYFYITFNWNELWDLQAPQKTQCLQWGTQMAFEFYPSNFVIHLHIFYEIKTRLRPSHLFYASLSRCRESFDMPC